ncbi:MAG TPA: hypothetical protein VM888_00345 [Chitinophagaceae bacterium]|nr:hypothetical protein [Chitinophagaceae bacterium]
MVDQQIISNLNLEPAETIVGAYTPSQYKVYKIPEISQGKIQVYVMELGTEGDLIDNDTNIIYSRRGYFLVSNEFLKNESKCAVYAHIAKKLDVKLEKMLSQQHRCLAK